MATTALQPISQSDLEFMLDEVSDFSVTNNLTTLWIYPLLGLIPSIAHNLAPYSTKFISMAMYNSAMPAFSKIKYLHIIYNETFSLDKQSKNNLRKAGIYTTEYKHKDRFNVLVIKCPEYLETAISCLQNTREGSIASFYRNMFNNSDGTLNEFKLLAMCKAISIVPHYNNETFSKDRELYRTYKSFDEYVKTCDSLVYNKFKYLFDLINKTKEGYDFYCKLVINHWKTDYTSLLPAKELDEFVFPAIETVECLGQFKTTNLIQC